MNTMPQQEEILQTCLKKARTSLSRKPEGKISIFNNHNSIQYYWKGPLSEKWCYLSKKKEMKLIRALAQKDYDERFIQTAEKQLKRLEWLIRMGAEQDIHSFYQALAQVYTQLPPPRQQLVIPYILPDDLFAAAWMDVKYQGKEFWEGDPVILTDRDERVRSKSEKMIADKLLQSGIFYHYEYPLKTKEWGTIYPDFTLLDVWNRREVILEHFGLMGNAEYSERMIKKYELYIREGFVPGFDFLFTLESGNLLLDTHTLEKMLRVRFPHIL